MRKIILRVLALVLAAAASGFFWWQWAAGAIAPEFKVPAEGEARQGRQGSRFKNEKIFVIKKGESVSSVAERLREEELIRSSLAFRILVAKEGLSKKIQAGDFRPHPGMTAAEVAQELTHGILDVWVTIPEGWRAEEIAGAISSQFTAFDPSSGRGFHSSQFLEEAKGKEGYLFPDTYLIPREATAKKIVDIFLKNFEKKFDEKLRQEAEKQGLTVDQVLTLASIVEREARADQDRPIVAGILIKRWQNDWPLQVDAAVQYAVASRESPARNASHSEAGGGVGSRESEINWWPKRLTKEDLKIDSPYNTYRNKGLPPGPICNPGLASIKAVIYPQHSEYWYYLSDSQGQMHYGQTDQEHVENINKYLR